MVRWLTEQGLDAGSFRTEYGADDDEAAPLASEPESAPEPAP